MTTKSTILSSFVALAALAWAAAADDTKETPIPGGLLERIIALEKRTASAEADAQADRALISMQSKQIVTLQEDLKAAKESAATATANAKTELAAQLKANRKEVYTDIGSIFRMEGIDRFLFDFNKSHEHDVKAKADGYLFGVRNGHHNETACGSYQMMPRTLQEKCDRIKAE